MKDIFDADDEHSPAREASYWYGPPDPVPQRKAQPTLMAQLVELQEENARLREKATKYDAIEQAVERGCYSLVFWDTDRDAWFDVKLNDLF